MPEPQALVAGLAVLLALLGLRPDPGARLRRLLAGPGVPSHRDDDEGAPEVDEPLVLDLVASALAAGSPPAAALAVVGAAVGGARGQVLGSVAARLRLGADWSSAWQDCGAERDRVDVSSLRRALGLAVSTGAPAAGLLQETAAEVRRRRHRRSQAAAARLGVRMVLPLGLCSLPAFVAWAVLPVVLSLAGRLLTG